MPLYWVSIKVIDSDDDGFIGAVILNRPTADRARIEALRLARENSCGEHSFEACSVAVPTGERGPGVPADAIGKLLTYEELDKIFGDLVPIPGT